MPPGDTRLARKFIIRISRRMKRPNKTKEIHMNTRISLSILMAGAGLCMMACEQKNEPVTRSETPSRSTQPSVPPAADNTGMNRGDADTHAKTPMSQSQSAADVKITAEIRRAIMEDKAMSMNAQNCKVITDKGGMVTLRGVVNSDEERRSIEAKAKAVAGVMSVDNQLEVKTN